MVARTRHAARRAAGNRRFATDFGVNEAIEREPGDESAPLDSDRRVEPGQEAGSAGVLCGRSGVRVRVWRWPLRDADGTGGESCRV